MCTWPDWAVDPFLFCLALNALVFLVQHQLSRRRVAPAPDVAKSRKTAASRRPEGADRSAEFWLFQTQWLAVYLVIMLADWLQGTHMYTCLLYTSPSPRDVEESRMPSSA